MIRIMLVAALCAAGFAQNPAVTVNIDANANRHAINPLIYGVNHADATALSDLNFLLNRYGGNNTSRTNWQINADNRGQDWYFESVPLGPATQGEPGDSFISMTKSAGAEPMLTIPIIGWIARLGASRTKLASFSIAKYGPQTGNDSQWFPDAGNGIRTTGAYVTGNDPNDANIPNSSAYQQQWVQHLVGKWGFAVNGGLKYYILDNEHSIWFSTHRDVKPQGPHAAEIRDLVLDYAAKIKAVDPGARVVGPEEWGWSGFIFSGYDQQVGASNNWTYFPDRQNVMGGMDYVPWLLQEWKNAGTRPIDVFTLHYYPQSGEFSNDVSSSMQLTRNKSTRSLWDPTYKDPTWINDYVRLIPRMKQWVDTYYYAGTPIGITEYNWGAESHINGATTQADILGIFGREGLDLGTRWTTPAASTPTYKAMKMYRNYDGNKSSFGDTSVAASVPNPDNLSAFAAVRTSDGAMTVMVISKVLSGSRPVTLNLSNFAGTGTAQVYQLTATNVISRLSDVAYPGSTVSAAVPAQSITLFVLPTSGSNVAPTAVMTANPLSGQAPLNVIFDGTASTDPDGSIAMYEWQFGTGAAATGPAASYTYASAGTYTATLKVTDNVGASSTTSKVITVSAPAPACAVRYAITTQTSSTFQASVTITNTGTAAINGWTLAWTFPGNQKITSMSNATYKQTGKTVSAKNVAANALINPGANTAIGFNASYSGTNSKPSAFKLNGISCQVQ